MSQQAKPDISDYLSSPKKFHLEMPLYVELKRELKEIDEKICNLLKYNGTIDAYCIWCDKESVFDADEYYSNDYGTPYWNRNPDFIRVSYVCTRNKSHAYYTYYLKLEGILLKIGQYPSVADFQIPQVEKYRSLLGEDSYKEMTKGIGLAAHGVGIGSFVYLRRIFEKLIQDAHEEAKKKRFPEKKYIKARMEEKIKILENYLPTFLVENRNLYKILSKGIHELDEGECLKFFVAVKIGIEQILDEKIIVIDRKRKSDEAKKALTVVSQAVSQTNPNLVKGKFRVIKGAYGAGELIKDVTQELSNLIKDDRLTTTASNAFVGDPAPGTPKFLVIEYEFNGVKSEIKFSENEVVTLP